MSLGTAYPERCATPNILSLKGMWKGGGAASAWTSVSGAEMKGVSGVAYNAATGKFLLTFTDVGVKLLYCQATIHRAAASSPLIVSFDIANLSLTAKTIPLEVWDVDAGSVLTDPATTDYISMEIIWKTTT